MSVYVFSGMKSDQWLSTVFLLLLVMSSKWKRLTGGGKTLDAPVCLLLVFTPFLMQVSMQYCERNGVFVFLRLNERRRLTSLQLFI